MNHSDDFNFLYYNGHLLIGSSPSNISGNGVCNKSIVDAILPRYFNGVQVYGTGYYSISQLSCLKTVFIPSTYRQISEDTFHGDRALETVTFEDQRSIIYFGFWLFLNANISSITIPYKAKHISIITSFFGCKNLKSVYYQGMLNITSNENTFAGVPADLKIFV